MVNKVFVLHICHAQSSLNLKYFSIFCINTHLQAYIHMLAAHIFAEIDSKLSLVLSLVHFKHTLHPLVKVFLNETLEGTDV